MPVRFALITSLLLTSATPLLAQDAAAPAVAPAATGQAAKPVKPKKICRQDTDTGTIIATTTCHTKEEWAQIDASSQTQGTQALSQMRRGAGMHY
jgi:hypothetical protein